jgi:hypothetical protein
MARVQSGRKITKGFFQVDAETQAQISSVLQIFLMLLVSVMSSGLLSAMPIYLDKWRSMTRNILSLPPWCSC